MAAIDKICELSGEYGYSNMFLWKKNSIQVMPKFRNKFRKSNSVLYIKKVPTDVFYDVSRFYDVSALDTFIYMSNKQRKAHISWFYSQGIIGNPNIRVINNYMYCLKVLDSHLQGEVNGNYINWSRNIKTVIRKIKRITRNYKLKVKFLNDKDWDNLM